MGDWSICTTLSIWLTPRRPSCGPGLGANPPSRRTRARASVSFNKELLPYLAERGLDPYSPQAAPAIKNATRSPIHENTYP